MSEDKNGKKAIWMYAVILFTSAFIVLLLTGISQIKFNKNIDEFKNQISSEEKAKNNFYLNLNSALEENKKLLNELNTTKEELSKTKSAQDKQAKELSDIKSNYSLAQSSYEALLLAEDAYRKEDIINCATILSKQCNSTLLGETALIKYNNLWDKTAETAAKKLYFKGYNNYLKGSYEEAIKELQQSIGIMSDAYFSDDCYYYIAYAEFKLGQYAQTKNYIQLLLEKFPESSFAGDADDLLRQLKAKNLA